MVSGILSGDGEGWGMGEGFVSYCDYMGGEGRGGGKMERLRVGVKRRGMLEGWKR